MSGELLRQSQDLRALVVAVRLAMQQRADVTTHSLSAWEEWALGEADKLDPIMSGQIISHLYPPVPPAEEMQCCLLWLIEAAIRVTRLFPTCPNCSSG
ncbi:hypothetical protein [Novosphingobium sp.]|uniref:hypothetical protein n=1 Tax=Novosphingobium sp. TaxID=1874826 RepID=UPI00352A79E2